MSPQLSPVRTNQEQLSPGSESLKELAESAAKLPMLSEGVRLSSPTQESTRSSSNGYNSPQRDQVNFASPALYPNVGPTDFVHPTSTHSSPFGSDFNFGRKDISPTSPSTNSTLNLLLNQPRTTTPSAYGSNLGCPGSTNSTTLPANFQKLLNQQNALSSKPSSSTELSMKPSSPTNLLPNPHFSQQNLYGTSGNDQFAEVPSYNDPQANYNQLYGKSNSNFDVSSATSLTAQNKLTNFPDRQLSNLDVKSLQSFKDPSNAASSTKSLQKLQQTPDFYSPGSSQISNPLSNYDRRSSSPIKAPNMGTLRRSGSSQSSLQKRHASPSTPSSDVTGTLRSPRRSIPSPTNSRSSSQSTLQRLGRSNSITQSPVRQGKPQTLPRTGMESGATSASQSNKSLSQYERKISQSNSAGRADLSANFDRPGSTTPKQSLNWYNKNAELANTPPSPSKLPQPIHRSGSGEFGSSQSGLSQTGSARIHGSASGSKLVQPGSSLQSSSPQSAMPSNQSSPQSSTPQGYMASPAGSLPQSPQTLLPPRSSQSSPSKPPVHPIPPQRSNPPKRPTQLQRPVDLATSYYDNVPDQQIHLKQDFINKFGTRKAPIASPEDHQKVSRKESLESTFSSDSRESVVSAASYRNEARIRRFFNY